MWGIGGTVFSSNFDFSDFGLLFMGETQVYA